MFFRISFCMFARMRTGKVIVFRALFLNIKRRDVFPGC